MVEEMPPEVRAEVRDFVEFLLSKHRQRPGRALRQDWAGALREQGQKCTALELQRQALDWRGD
jgi:hypothetical protein